MPCASSPILPFQHTAARRRLHPGDSNSYYRVMVSTHSRAEAVALFDRTFHESQQCFNTQPPKGGCYTNFPSIPPPFFVSTHSHPKAAATMPCASSPILPFQHTAARRRLLALLCSLVVLTLVSTRSRAKAAALNDKIIRGCSTVSTHSRAKAAAVGIMMSKHGARFQHTAAWRRLHLISNRCTVYCWFQHTAAWRWLPCIILLNEYERICFNTQPRGGGCQEKAVFHKVNIFVSTHSRVEAAARVLLQ